MKSLFLQLTVATALVFSTVLLNEQQSATARPVSSLTPSQAQQLSRDLIPSQSQEFFRQGQFQIERELQFLYQPERIRKPILKNNVTPQRELNHLPQLSGDFWQPTQS